MRENILATAARLSDDALLARVEELAGHARETTVELVAHLAEVETRRLYRREGAGSLYGYCRQVLRLSEHAAYHRMKVARAVREWPVILDLLADGSLNLTTIRLLAPHITESNHRGLLAEATGRSRREVQRMVARLSPQPDVPASIRKLPAPRHAPVTPAAPALLLVPSKAPTDAPARAVPGPGVASPESHRPVIAPLAPERYRVQFTVGEETEGKLRRLQDLLRREIPDGDPSVIVDRALTLLLAEVERKKLGATSKPRLPRAVTAGSRTIPAHVRRSVARRDGGQCAFVANGRRCSERSYLEFHHVQPYARGGEATVDNIALRCRAHNAYEAEVVFGSRGPSRTNSVRTEFTGGLPDWARTPM